MPVIRIEDLAQVMIEELAEQYGYAANDIAIEVIGTKPGEKLYEELMSDEEMRRSKELADYFAVLPAFRGFYTAISYNYDDVISENVQNPYNSSVEAALSLDEVRSFLIDNQLIGQTNTDDQASSQRYWPGDKESQ
jgi:FlaA1/EpsC-like NDP-sugar epimerase